MVVAGFRIVFMSFFYNKIRKLFDEDAALQHGIIMLLNQLRQEDRQDIDELLQGREINQDSIGDILKDIFNNISFSTCHAPSITNQLLHWSSTGLDVTLGTLYGLSYATFFAVNGYRGLEIMCQLISTQCDLSTFAYTYKVIISIITGLSSGVLGFMTGLDARDVANAIYVHLKKHPEDIIKLVAILIVSGVAATPVAAAAHDILRKDNVFDLTENLIGWLFVAGNTLLSVSFDIYALFSVLMKKEDNAFTTHHLQQWLEVNDLPKEVLLSLRKNNLFAQQQKSDEETPAMALEPRQAYTS